MEQKAFSAAALDFLNRLFVEVKRNQIEILRTWEIDHLCYRVDSLSRYQELKEEFAKLGDLLIESEVNGRPIATYRLSEPIQFEGWRIDVVELPAPKPLKPTPEGFEHIEVVCDVPFAVLEKKYLHLQIDLSGLKKDFNQEFEIRLKAGSVKFHHISLGSVIETEKKTLAK